MTRRRAHCEGSIHRRKDGRWAGMLDMGWMNGKRVRPTVYGKTRAEVVDKLAALRKQQQAGMDLTAAPRTVGEWLAEWLRDFKAKDETRPATLDCYRIAVNRNLVPGLGRIALRKLGARDVQRYLTELAAERSPGRSPRCTRSSGPHCPMPCGSTW